MKTNNDYTGDFNDEHDGGMATPIKPLFHFENVLDWILIILAIFCAVMIFTGCKKDNSNIITTVDNVRVIISTKYAANDSIKFFTGGLPGVYYIKGPSKEFDYQLSNSYPAGSGSTYYKYCSNTATEWPYGNNSDSIRMEVIVNGSVVSNQSALGYIKYQIQY